MHRPLVQQRGPQHVWDRGISARRHERIGIGAGEGREANAPAIAAAATHGPMYLVIVCMVFPCLLGRRIWLCPILATQQTSVRTADPHSTLPLAGIRLHGHPDPTPDLRRAAR
jgi:hypothetical protein